MNPYTDLAKVMGYMIHDLTRELIQDPVAEGYWHPEDLKDEAEWQEVVTSMIDALDLMAEEKNDVNSENKIQVGIDNFGYFAYYFMSDFVGHSRKEFIGHVCPKVRLAQHLYHMLCFYKEHSKGYLDSEEDWDVTVDLMIFGLGYMADSKYVEETDPEITEVMQQAINLFGEYCFHIFDYDCSM